MLKEIKYNFKSQPVIAAVTVVGTALSILLVMVVVMAQEIKVAPFAPRADVTGFCTISISYTATAAGAT